MSRDTDAVNDSIVPFHSELIEMMIIGDQPRMSKAREIFDTVHELVHHMNLLDSAYIQLEMHCFSSRRMVNDSPNAVGACAWHTTKLHREISDASANVNTLVDYLRTLTREIGWDSYRRADFIHELFVNIGSR